MMNTLKTPRRSEFDASSSENVGEVLRAARYGHLSWTSPEGFPEIRPLNYVPIWRDDRWQICFHTSPKGELAQWRGPACLAVEDGLCWLPSYWRNRQLACPATTYYRSAILRGHLREMEEEEKAEAMQAFMERYQPEGGHLPMADRVYRGPLAALSLLSLEVESFSCKAKYGQHLPESVRQAMVTALLERRLPGDLACAQAIRRYNEPAATEGWTWDPTAIPAEEIWRLLAPTYWGHRRTRAGVEEQRDAAWMVLGFLRDGRLLAHLRLHRIDARGAFLYDVVVDPEARGQGLGKELMRQLMERVAATEVKRVLLDTQDAMSLYARYGFEVIATNPWGSKTMLWSGHDESTL